MRLVGIGAGFPEHYVDQATVTQALARTWPERGGPSAAAIERIHRAACVERRHLTLPVESCLAAHSFSEVSDLFARAATELGEVAVREGLERAGVGAGEVDLLVVSTTTGLAVPSIDARLVSRVGFRSDVKRLPVFGLGCAAGVAGIARSAEYLRAFPDHVAVAVSVELCSLIFQRDDLSTVNVVASALFADGAACAVLAGARRPRADDSPAPRVVASRSLLFPDTEGIMGFRFGDDGFHLVLGGELPRLVSERIAESVDAFLADQGLGRREISVWAVHPGGPKVLRAVSDALSLPAGVLDKSWDCLRRYGNVSSASVLYILRDVMADRPARGTYGLVIAMGPGFGLEVLLLHWD